MNDVFLKLIDQLNSSVVVLMLILILAFVLTYKIAAWLTAWTQRFDHHASRIEKIENMNHILISTQTKVDLIYQFVNPNATTRAASPIGLTPVGERVVSDIGALEIFKNHALNLTSTVKAKNPKNAYDIQQISFDVAKRQLIELLKESELKTIKEAAYKRGLLVEDILSVFGVLLRNKILEDMKIPIAEVDKGQST